MPNSGAARGRRAASPSHRCSASQYSQIFIDFRGIRDAVMREAGFDYFENSRRETYANRAYCIANPMGWRGYSNGLWGLAAATGPGNFRLPYQRRDAPVLRLFRARPGRASRMGATTGRLRRRRRSDRCRSRRKSSFPCAEALMKTWPRLFDRYGFKDSFNPSFTYRRASVETGSVDPQRGWVANDYLGIDQGPILLQAANYRDDFVWRYMRRVPAIRLGLKRAGFTGGWLGYQRICTTRLSFDTPVSLNASIATQ